MIKMRRYIGAVIAIFVISMHISGNAFAYCNAPTDGLIGWWTLDDISAPYEDQAGSNNATVTGTISPTEGVINSAIDGTGYLSTNTVTDYNSLTAMTVSFWTNVNSFGGYVGFLDIESIIKVRSGWNSNDIAVSTSGWSTQSGSHDTPNILEVNKWYHVVVTYDNSQPAGTPPNVYIDGVSQTLGTAFSTAGTYSPPANSTVRIGAVNFSGIRSLNGSMDEVRIYNRILTNDEILELYKATAPGHMRFNSENAALEYCDGDDWVMAGTGSYAPTGAYFNDGPYLTKTGGLSGVTDGTQYAASFWFKFDSGTDWQRIMGTEDGGTSEIFTFGQNDGGALMVYNNAPGGGRQIAGTFGSGLDDGQWHHFMISVDTVTTTGYAYLDGADVSAGFTTLNNSALDFTIDNWGIGIVPSLGWNLLENGGIADFWLDLNNFIDFSSADQRNKFRSPTGAPMYLGADGSLPTGQTPEIFLSGDVENWHINKGTGGGFTENGALEYASANPGSPYVDPPTNGLIGWWKLDELAGTTILDSSGNGNDATLLNSNAAELGHWGRLGKSINSTIENQNIAMRIQADGVFPAGTNPPFTVSAWINLRATCTGLWGNGGWGIGNEISLKANNDIFRFSGWGGWHQAPGVATYDEWVLLTSTYDGTNLRLYENASQRTSTPQALTITYDQLTIGSIGGACGGGGRAAFDDLRLYNRALSQPEIQAIYEAATCTAPTGAIGSIVYNQDNLVMQYCNGKDWVAMGPIGGTGGGGCSSPAGDAGDIMFNTDYNTMQFCNAQDWVAIGKQTAPTEGLVAHFMMNETSGSSIIEYVSANNGTWSDGSDNDVSGESRNGKLNKAIEFDGSNDQIAFPLSTELQNMQSFTYSVWVKWDGTNGDYQGILDIRDIGHIHTGFNDSSVSLRVYGWSGSDGVWRLGNTPVGEWRHIVVSYSYLDPPGTDPRFYFDGRYIGGGSELTTPTGSFEASAQANGTIGRVNLSGSRFFNGIIDDVRVYNRVLTDTEIKQLYYATK